MSGVRLFIAAMLARAYPRVIGMRRQPSWLINDTILPLLSVSAFACVYRAMHAPEAYIGFVLLGGAMTAFWLNVLWSMGAQLYWERSGGNLELYILAPASMMSILAGMALGGMALTLVRASVILSAGILIFDVPFNPTSWWLLVGVFLITLLALYGMGMMFASLFLLWGREAWHIVNLLQEPIYLLTGMNFPLNIFPYAVATVAAIIPLTTGMDAMRQILFRTEGVWQTETEIAVLVISSAVFLVLAKVLLDYLERRARTEGKISVKWE
jgi:ABC-2 type transport system permease protein